MPTPNGSDASPLEAVQREVGAEAQADQSEPIEAVTSTSGVTTGDASQDTVSQTQTVLPVPQPEIPVPQKGIIPEKFAEWTWLCSSRN